MPALAIDTSGDVASIALATENGLISELNFSHKMDLLRRLMPNVDRLVSDAGRSRADIDAVVTGLGPGSFTGLRIGVAAAKAIAYALGKPIVGISTLDVLAEGASAACPKFVVPLVHARPGEVFWARYGCASGTVERLTKDRASTVDDLISEVRQDGEIVFCGDGADRNRAALEAEFGPSCILDRWFDVPRAAVLATLGIRRLLRGEVDDAFTLAPTYVRRPTPVVRLEGREWG